MPYQVRPSNKTVVYMVHDQSKGLLARRAKMPYRLPDSDTNYYNLCRPESFLGLEEGSF
jgi:hypothetical protein